MSERSKESHSRCDVAIRVGSNPTLCIFYFSMVNKGENEQVSRLIMGKSAKIGLIWVNIA